MIDKSKILTPLSILLAGVLIAGGIIFSQKGKVEKEKILSPQEAAQKAIDFINENLLEKGTSASLVSVSEESGIYKFKLKIGENEYDSYVTKDGKLLFTGGFDLTSKPQAQRESAPQEIEKREKPDVKLFVMSYCPFGLQMEKAFLPVYNLLKDKAEMGIYFVDYIMHGKKEIDENLRQYCIQKEEKEKYSNYLGCFVQDGDFEKCLNQAGIDKNKMNSCIEATDREYKITELYNDKNSWLNGYYPQFNVHKDLNEKYGVQGSPTLVINDTVLNVERSPEKIKEAICQGFISPPAECSENLSTEVPSSGFGGGTGGSQAKCE